MIFSFRRAARRAAIVVGALPPTCPKQKLRIHRVVLFAKHAGAHYQEDGFTAQKGQLVSLVAATEKEYKVSWLGGDDKPALEVSCMTMIKNEENKFASLSNQTNNSQTIRIQGRQSFSFAPYGERVPGKKVP